MRFSNNTSYKTIPAQELLNDVAHLFLVIDTDAIEHVELTDSKVTVMGIDTLLLEHKVNKNLKTSGKILWFDESSGDGMIRLDSGKSVHFFSCNVKGADSLYPQLVTNVNFQEGAAVTLEIPAACYMFRALGAINVEAV